MSVATPEFFVFACGVCVLYNLFDGRRYHLAVLAVANLLFLASWLPSWYQATLAATVLLSGYVMVRLVGGGWLRGEVALLLQGLFLVAVFVHVRQPPAWFEQPEGGSGLLLVGYSYVMFKQIHMLVEASAGSLCPVTPQAYFDYMCGFYVWLSGPIQRYDDFAGQMAADRQQTRLAEVRWGVERIIDGCLKTLVFASWVAPFSRPQTILNVATGPSLGLWAHGAAFFFGYYVFLYLNFSGYCDIVIGVAATLGLRLPENFQRPFLARNLLDFWQRWHITLSQWLRDYVFNFLYAFGLRAAPRVGLLAAALAYLATFDLVGIWHGLDTRFLLYGLMHGVGTALNYLGHAFLTRILSREAHRRYQRSVCVRVLGTLVCQTYVALSMLVFAYPLSTLRLVWTTAWRGGGG
jgi:alginate O-acetyltransferase complex protein AlgI